MALGSTQSLTEMSTRCISWGKGGRCTRLTTLPPSCAVVMKSGNLNFLEPSGPLQACNGNALMKLDFVSVFESGPSSGINDSELPKRRILTPFPRDWSPHLDSREHGKQIPPPWMNLELHCHFHKRSRLVPALRRTKPAYALTGLRR